MDGKRRTKLCPCEFLIPLEYQPDGPEGARESVPREFFDKVFKTLDRQFGGWTWRGNCSGSWHGELDDSMSIEVSVPKDQIEKVRVVVRAIGYALKQEKMYFRVGRPSVEMLDADGSTGFLFEAE